MKSLAISSVVYNEFHENEHNEPRVENKCSLFYHDMNFDE